MFFMGMYVNHRAQTLFQKKHILNHNTYYFYHVSFITIKLYQLVLIVGQNVFRIKTYLFLNGQKHSLIRFYELLHKTNYQFLYCLYH